MGGSGRHDRHITGPYPPYLVTQAEIGLALQKDDDLVVMVVDVGSQAAAHLDRAHRAGGPLGSPEVGDAKGLTVEDRIVGNHLVGVRDQGFHHGDASPDRRSGDRNATSLGIAPDSP